MPYFAPIQEEQYTATDETQCIQVIIPNGDEFKALLAGMIKAPASIWSYADPDSAQADGLAAVWDDALSQIDWSGCVTAYNNLAPGNINLFCVLAGITSPGTLTYTNAANQPFGYVMECGTGLPSAPGIAAYNECYLEAGDYEYQGLYAKTTSSGICSVNVRTASGSALVTSIISSIDLYGLANQLYIATGTFTIATSDLYRVEIRNGTTKNASSAGYRFSWTSHHIHRVP